MSAEAVDLGVIPAASVKRFLATIKKDGVAWTGIDSATITFENPDRSTQSTQNMTLYSDSTGQWYYDSSVTDFTTEGYWTATIRVVDGSITIAFPQEIGFYVKGQP